MATMGYKKIAWPIRPEHGEWFSYICPLSGCRRAFFEYDITIGWIFRGHDDD